MRIKQYIDGVYGYAQAAIRRAHGQRAVRDSIREPVKRCETQVSIGIQPRAVKLLTMILVVATKARMIVMYVFIRLRVSLTENVFTASPPPRIATSSRPFKHIK